MGTTLSQCSLSLSLSCSLLLLLSESRPSNGFSYLPACLSLNVQVLWRLLQHSEPAAVGARRSPSPRQVKRRGESLQRERDRERATLPLHFSGLRLCVQTSRPSFTAMAMAMAMAMAWRIEGCSGWAVGSLQERRGEDLHSDFVSRANSTVLILLAGFSLFSLFEYFSCLCFFALSLSLVSILHRRV